MPGVTEDQLRLAREVDLLSYLQVTAPADLQKITLSEYRSATHSSLVISNGLWYWNRGQFGGRSALDYLVNVESRGLVAAVKAILRSPASPASSLPVREAPSPPKKFTFYPPKPRRYSNTAVPYLQKQGVSSAVIWRCARDGILYESHYFNPDSVYHNATICVFAGKDASGATVFASLRGTDTDLKQDKAGSDKRFNFVIPAKNRDSRYLAVFESPIDALSHATLQDRECWEGDCHRLSLGGTAPFSLIAFLERNPRITRVALHLDNDAAGLVAAAKIKAALAAESRFRHIKVSINPPRQGKDYNETLIQTISSERERKRLHRREADISI